MHIPHACAYPIAGLRPALPGRPATPPISEFRARDRHRAAFGPWRRRTRSATPRSRGCSAREDGDLRGVARAGATSDGLRALGYGKDVPVVEGALRQERLLAVAPREPDADDLAAIYIGLIRARAWP